ncbi:nitronate monooxygenase [Companilactobacillus mishanensis]|uniref:Probable nitronate monooxygenase n=1 Tax=Companilactobacillus mishanensis TaxID=2486008 RepID=A0A5P0ZJZ3_9LACO|nr:nitronate monooxygenase [Companilactobacillus mishanensis]MQS45559.1 enoyl-[acyl-carrier-protein] reductase FabK [Companilactobacillus mishanensis]MQS53399.1 enoyl-[acyl-carrier-protein] reductase FabK [Companilactobacillus mishanensis]MQS89864.1 enoyl-[acyl-carrier-protein] reductase FabK [Companilactobacillus mishanensis]
MNELCEVLGTKYPVIQGAMQELAIAELAASVSNGGGLGIIAAGGKTADQVRAEIKKAKTLTDKNFGVNLMLMAKNTPDIVKVIIEEHVPIVTTGAGTPKPYMKDLKDAGIKVIPVIPNVKIAKKMEALGADAVIAEGMEGGGHIGVLTSQVLWPQVADAVSIPVVASGGIADGRGVVNAFVAGCKGVQCGTIFSISKESPVGDNWRNLVIGATDTSTIVAGSTIKDASRIIKNDMATHLVDLEMDQVSRDEFNSVMDEGLKNAVHNDDVEKGLVFSGQVAGMINESLHASEIVEKLMTEAQQVLDKKIVLV